LQNYWEQVLSEASPRVLEPKNMVTADGSARPRAPGLGHPRAQFCNAL
jgi:hypothetical protein